MNALLDQATEVFIHVCDFKVTQQREHLQGLLDRDPVARIWELIEADKAAVGWAEGCVAKCAEDSVREKLEGESQRMARFVELYLFGGLAPAEAALMVGIPSMSGTRYWRAAKARLYLLCKSEKRR